MCGAPKPAAIRKKMTRLVKTILAMALLGAILFSLVEASRAYFVLRTPGWHEWADFTIPVDTVPSG
jgi:hypothetical protein